MKTSTKISLKFTTFTIVIIFLFGLTANLMFLHSRYTHSISMIHKPNPQNIHMKQVLGRNRGPDIDVFPMHSPESQLIIQNRKRRNISQINDRYFLYLNDTKVIIVLDISQNITAQENLFRTSIYLLILFALLAYIFSLFFIKTALRNLQKLVHFAQDLDLDNLHQTIQIDGPNNDEIKILANTLNTSLKKLHEQAYSLKDFVAHASHELKTPLMAMSTEIDIGIKTKDLKSLLKTKKYINAMNDLIQQLLLITQLESEIKLKTTKTNVEEISNNTINMIKTKYTNKTLNRNIEIQKDLSIKCHTSSREMILQNLLDNAAKYTKNKGNITVEINDKNLKIKDTGIGIANSQLEKIRDRFRQEDNSRTDHKSFGLGLYLVKKLVDKHDRNIKVKSKKGEGTEITIEF